MKNVTMFMDEMPKELQAEGLGVQMAVISGECNRCGYLAKCSTDSSFKFPAEAFCMKRKEAIIAAWDKEEPAPNG